MSETKSSKFILTFFFLYLVFAVSTAGVCRASGKTQTQDPASERHQGRYFRWSAPVGWRSSESTSGVDISSPDKKSGVSFALLMRSYGKTSPLNFLAQMLQRIPGYRNFRTVSVKNLPDQPSGIPGTSWKVVESELTYMAGNVPVRAIWTCGINSYYGVYDASLVGYQSSLDTWQKRKYLLSNMASAISIANPREVAGNDTLIPVRNHPLDNSGVLESGRLKDQSRDRISKARREGTMGQERVKDPETGKIYTMPLDKYDGTVGGYRNPKRPNEILVPVEPGE